VLPETFYLDERTGLSEDYINAWSDLGSIANLVKTDSETANFLVLRRPKVMDGRELYSDYVFRKYPNLAEEILDLARPDALQELDSVVRKYNEMSFPERLVTYFDYVEKIREIIKGYSPK